MLRSVRIAAEEVRDRGLGGRLPTIPTVVLAAVSLDEEAVRQVAAIARCRARIHSGGGRLPARCPDIRRKREAPSRFRVRQLGRWMTIVAGGRRSRRLADRDRPTTPGEAGASSVHRHRRHSRRTGRSRLPSTRAEPRSHSWVAGTRFRCRARPRKPRAQVRCRGQSSRNRSMRRRTGLAHCASHALPTDPVGTPPTVPVAVLLGESSPHPGRQKQRPLASDPSTWHTG
jgi:hypothetical protein